VHTAHCTVVDLQSCEDELAIMSRRYDWQF